MQLTEEEHFEKLNKKLDKQVEEDKKKGKVYFCKFCKDTKEVGWLFKSPCLMCTPMQIN